MKAAVGALGAAFAGEHAGRILALPLEWEDARREGEIAGRILGKQPAQDIAPVPVAR